MEQKPKLGCLLMAAGNARRFGENKLAASWKGKPLVARAMDAIPADIFDQIVVVTQYPEVEELATQMGYACLRNEHPDWGISHTISMGTKYLQDCDAILYLVSDQPLLSESSVRRVAEAWLENPSQIVGAAHNGKRGNPCMFPRTFYGELLDLDEDCGGNTVVRAHLDQLLLVEIPKEELTDVDTPEALRDLQRQQSQRP